MRSAVFATMFTVAAPALAQTSATTVTAVAPSTSNPAPTTTAAPTSPTSTTPNPTPATPIQTPATPTPTPTGPRQPQAGDDPRRLKELAPSPEESPPDGRIRFEADPVGDGALLLGTVGFAGLVELVLSTGEIRPQQIDANFSTSNLLSIDRSAVNQKIDPHAATFSNATLIAAVGFGVLDPILTGFRDGEEAALVDAFMYAEAATMAWGLTDIAKVAVRRPRPIAYIERSQALAAGASAATYDNTSTDSTLSFFSGHAAVTSSIAAAATYIAFARAPGTLRPWITLLVGAAMTSFVSVERVRAGAHFPTDVIAGSLAGTGTGLLVVHLHREDNIHQRPVWVGFSPANGGGTATLGGTF